MNRIFVFLLIQIFFFSHSIADTNIEEHLKKTHVSKKKTGLHLIDCIYVINLDARPSKWKRVNTLFKMQGINCNRFSGINGWKIPYEIEQELAGPYPVRIPKGHLGCLLSHLSVLKDAYKRKWNIIWVCEDDIEFIENVRQLPQLIIKLNKIDPDWDVFYTDIDIKNTNGERVPSVAFDFRPNQTHKEESYYLNRVQLTKDIMKIGQRYGLYSAIISRRGIKKIINYFKKEYLWTHIDIDIHYIPNIKEYSTTRDIVSNWPDSVFSDTCNEL